MPVIERDKQFLGSGWGFPPEFTKLGDCIQTKMSSNEEDIRESLVLLLSTRPGERIMQPAYGCGIHALVYEVLNESTVTEIVDMIERAILFFEPRIVLDNIDVIEEQLGQGKLLLNLSYRVRSTNTRSNMVYPFYLIEGTRVQI